MKIIDRKQLIMVAGGAPEPPPPKTICLVHKNGKMTEYDQADPKAAAKALRRIATGNWTFCEPPVPIPVPVPVPVPV